jgi:cell wall-associated NlpC family hydrolase
MMAEKEERQHLIEVSKTWLKTPYIPEARVKGCGCDCGTFLAEVFAEAGFIDTVPIPHYPMDIACNCAVPKYLNKIKEYTTKVDREPLPGDIIFYQFPGSKVPHHAAICVDNEYIIHSYVRQGVTISNRKGYKNFEVGIYCLNKWV